MKEKVPHQLGPQTYHCKQNSVYSFKNKLKYTFKYINLFLKYLILIKEYM